MTTHHRVALLGFSEFERGALGSYFRLAGKRSPAYELVPVLTDAEYLVADADHAPSVQLVLATERVNETVFIGSQAPAGAMAWTPRPIDALHVMRELDAMVMLTETQRPQSDGRPVAPPTVIEKLWQQPLQPHQPAASQVLAAPSPAAPVAPAPPAPAPAPRALLVDDSDIALRFLQSRLAPWRLQVDVATTSTQALELLEQFSYDLVFLDIELGDGSHLDGLALCQKIKQSALAVSATVVMVSAHHSELDRVRGALAGCDAYLGKPLVETELQRLLLRQGLKAPARAAAAPP